MNDLRNILTGIAASALSFLLGYGARILVVRVRALRTHRFWRPLAGPVTFVIGSLTAPPLLDYEPSGVVGRGDLKTLLELTHVFRSSKLGQFEIEDETSLTPHQRSGNLVIIGGGDANTMTPRLLDELGTKVRLVNHNAIDPPVLEDHVVSPPHVYRPGKAAGGPVTSDYGVLVRARNPDGTGGWVVIIAGCLGFGSWAGLRAIERLPMPRGNTEFAAIYHTTIVDGAPGRVEVLWQRKLAGRKARVRSPLMT